MVTKATVTSSKTVDFCFRGPFGFQAHTVLVAADSNSPDQYAFESSGGNIDVMGLVDFAEVRPHCTEVTLAVHYEIKNKIFAWLDRKFRFVDAFLNSELRSIRAHFEGIAAPVRESMPLMPALQPATA
jgi:signal-transduction protein with cAMP-binding, CBS, and nucleotidyltransferase domain